LLNSKKIYYALIMTLRYANPAHVL